MVSSLLLSKSSNFLDEDYHFILLDGAGVILVKLFETRFEILLSEFATISHIDKSLPDENLGFVLVKSIQAVPTIVNAILDN